MPSDFYSLAGILLTIFGAIWTLAIWISKQLWVIKDLIYSKNSELREFIIEKLQYHEKHDDTRFSQISNDIWEVRLRNAAADKFINTNGKLRRDLIEDEEGK